MAHSGLISRLSSIVFTDSLVSLKLNFIMSDPEVSFPRQQQKREKNVIMSQSIPVSPGHVILKFHVTYNIKPQNGSHTITILVWIWSENQDVMINMVLTKSFVVAPLIKHEPIPLLDFAICGRCYPQPLMYVILQHFLSPSSGLAYFCAFPHAKQAY